MSRISKRTAEAAAEAFRVFQVQRAAISLARPQRGLLWTDTIDNRSLRTARWVPEERNFARVQHDGVSYLSPSLATQWPAMEELLNGVIERSLRLGLDIDEIGAEITNALATWSDQRMISNFAVNLTSSPSEMTDEIQITIVPNNSVEQIQVWATFHGPRGGRGE